MKKNVFCTTPVSVALARVCPCAHCSVSRCKERAYGKQNLTTTTTATTTPLPPPSDLPLSYLETQVLKFQEQQNKVSASNDFFRGMSRDADLVVDGDLLMVSPTPTPAPLLDVRRCSGLLEIPVISAITVVVVMELHSGRATSGLHIIV